MLNYEIGTDLGEQRHTYLKFVLGITLLISIPLFAIELSVQRIAPVLWITLFIVMLVSNALRRSKHIAAAAWVYLLGVLFGLVVRLLDQPLEPNIYYLMLIPIALSVLLIAREGLVPLTVLTILAMLFATSAKTSFAVAVNTIATPAVVCVIIAFVAYANAGNILEMIYWAIDSQKKDANRAEAFYQQSEQLRDALLKLTQANSKLETLNTQLADQKRKVEEISRAKSVFLSNMSHELRTPLNVVIGYTSSMLTMPEMYNGVPLPEIYRNDIQLIKDNGHYLVGLINDILDLSKIEAGKLQLHHEVVELTSIFRGVIATATGLIKEKPIQIKPDFPDELPPVWADSLRLRQVILNLMSNAIKFTNTGSVTLSARIVENGIRISVVDTGIGIPEQALARIFDRFQQAEADTDKHFGGTGLGLDISKQLIVMHGSDLEVQSIVGAGSTFAFVMPLATPEQLGDGPLPQNMADLDNLVVLDSGNSAIDMVRTILLAEDEADTREMLRRAFEATGFIVIDTHDGAQVFELAMGLLPDVILLDIKLPNLDGWQVLDRLKADSETARIPVIAFSGVEDKDPSISHGAAMFLRKPVTAEEMLTSVEAVLSGVTSASS